MSPGNNRFRSIESYEQMELVHLSTHCVPFCSKSFQTKQRFGFLYMKCPSRDRAHWCRWAYIVKIHPSWWHKCVFWQLRYLHERLYCEYSKVGSHKIADWWLMECPCATLLAIHLLVFIHFFFSTLLPLGCWILTLQKFVAHLCVSNPNPKKGETNSSNFSCQICVMVFCVSNLQALRPLRLETALNGVKAIVPLVWWDR